MTRQSPKFRVLLFLFACLLAWPAATPADPTPASRPTLSAASSIDDILDVLQADGQNLQDFSATIKLSDVDQIMGDSSASFGTVVYQRKPDGDGRIHVIFTKKENADGNAMPENHQYWLEDGWLVERDSVKKTESRDQVLKQGEKIDLLKLGEGPFPLPIGQKKEDVKKLFDIRKIAPAADDPPNTVHLVLATRPNTVYARKYSSVDLWVDLKTGMPRRIQETPYGADVSVVHVTDLTDVKTNTGVGDKDFVQPPLPPGWQTISQPYHE